MYFDEGKDRNGLDRNRLFLSFNYQLTLLEMKAEIRDRILSHDKPVISAIYNDKKSQVSCNIIKSPKQRLEIYCFFSVSYYYYYYYYSPPPPPPLSFFLSVAHELVHGRSQELLDRIS